MTHLTAIILTYNEAQHIQACIQSVQFADDVLVFDSYSTDDTVALAEAAGAQVQQRKFDNYAGQRNAALDAVTGRADWVLFVDADERIPPELVQEIQQKMTLTAYAGWGIPRHNYIFGKLTLGAGWFPDYQTRLLRVGYAHYDPERQVHEVVILDGDEGQCDTPMIHYNYQDYAHFISKQQRYVAYDAQILHEQGVRVKFRNFILQPLRHFRWRFITLKGYRDGLHGLRLSVLMAWYEFRKYWILWQLGR
jgi:glycosyltransferase involved in cell wall biosynthesis